MEAYGIVIEIFSEIVSQDYVTVLSARRLLERVEWAIKVTFKKGQRKPDKEKKTSRNVYKHKGDLVLENYEVEFIKV